MSDKMTKELHLKLVEAWWDGELEYRPESGTDANEWIDCSKWKWAIPAVFEPPSRYRIRPQPKLRPWKPEEVPMPCLLKVRPDCLDHMQDRKIVWQALAVTSDGVATLSPTTGLGIVQDFNAMLNVGLYSVDGGKTWLPCGVEESQ